MIRISLIMLILFPLLGTSQEKDSVYLSKNIKEVQIIGLNANEKTPVTFTNISEKELERA